MNPQHKKLLETIRALSGEPTNHTFLNNYLGNDHPRYEINNPTLRRIARAWKKDNRELPARSFEALITSLVKGKSSTEKMLAGMLLDVATPEQRSFHPRLFDEWLNHVVGWAEVDTLCTGNFTYLEIPNRLAQWSKILHKLSRSRNGNKRRAALVFLCSPLRKSESPELAKLGLVLIDRLKSEDDILITKAISWVLRSMVPHHRRVLEGYLRDNTGTLPAIAVRETRIKLDTGTKSGRRQKK